MDVLNSLDSAPCWLMARGVCDIEIDHKKCIRKLHSVPTDNNYY